MISNKDMVENILFYIFMLVAVVIITDILSYIYYSKDVEYFVVSSLLILAGLVFLLVAYKIPAEIKLFMVYTLTISIMFFIGLIVLSLFMGNTERVKWAYTNATLDQMSTRVDWCDEDIYQKTLEETIDVYSVNSRFKLIKRDDIYLLYSVGPDLVDGKAKIALAEDSFISSKYAAPWRFMVNTFWLYRFSIKSHRFSGDVVREVSCKQES